MNWRCCRFLLSEEDLPTLLQGVCDRLTRQDFGSAAWIVLVEQAEGGVITAESGLAEDMTRVMTILRRGELPDCGRQALAQQDGLAVVCAAGQVAASLSCGPGVVGFLVFRPNGPAIDPGLERQCLTELARSVGHALRRLLAREEGRRREQQLRHVEERYQLALDASQAGLWDWNIQSGEIYSSPDRTSILDYEQSGGGPSMLDRVIHPEDKDRVLEILNAHLQGKSEEYRIEYRVRDGDGNWDWFLDIGRVVERDANNMPVRMTGTHQNITHQKRKDQALAEIQQQLHEAIEHERSFLQSVIDGASDPVMAIDLDYNLLLMNSSAGRLVQAGVDPADLTLKCYKMFHGSQHPCEHPAFPCPVRAVADKGQHITVVHARYHGNAINNTFEIEATPLKRVDGSLYGIIEVGRDITDRLRIEQELRESQSRLYRLAHHDTLTGLPNRLLLNDRLDQAINKARRNGTKVAVLFLDLDKFKTINDTLGHDVGDGLLVEVARRLLGHGRQSDTVARLGGDEFVFVLDDLGDAQGARVVAQKVMAAMARPVWVGGHELQVSTSIGIALFPDHGADIEQVIKCADMALYLAKEQGRSNYQLFRPEMAVQEGRLTALERRVEAAMIDGSLRVLLQPRFTTVGERIAVLETVVQWHHEEQGVLLADEFLPQIRQAGLLDAYETWLVSEVTAALARLSEQRGAAELPGLAIRLESTARLGQLVDTCRNLKSGPKRIELLVKAEEFERVREDCYGMASLLATVQGGFCLTGLGAYACNPVLLADASISSLVIDPGLVEAMDVDPQAARLVAALCALVQGLERTSIADGVLRPGQLALLQRFGCAQVQGELLSAPLAGEELAVLLRSQDRAS